MNGYFDLLFHFLALRNSTNLKNCTNMCTYLTGPSALFWMITVDRLFEKGMGQIFCPNPDLPKRNVASMAKKVSNFLDLTILKPKVTV